MKIGIVGPLDSSNKISDYIKKINTDVELKTYTREKAIESLEVMELCEEECDGIIFTGCGVYDAVKYNYNLTLPHTFVSRGGTSITKALFQIKNLNLNFNKFSIDVVESHILEDTLYEINLDPKNIYSFPFCDKVDEMEYASWHIKLFEEGKIDYALTGFYAVYKYLKEKGYPVFRLEATRPLIKVAYENLINDLKLNKAKYSQIAVEVLSLTNISTSKDNYYSDMTKKTDVDKLIINYVRDIQGSMFSFGRDEYVIFSNKGIIKSDENYNKLLFLKNDIKKHGFSLGVGIGIGITSYQAESNAYNALKRCISDDDLGIFMLDENDTLSGPLGQNDTLTYSLVTNDENLINLSEVSGLSFESISKIMSISKVRQSNIFDTKELADCLNISDRSARRILNKLVSVNLGRIYAKESSGSSGRPKHLVEILF